VSFPLGNFRALLNLYLASFTTVISFFFKVIVETLQCAGWLVITSPAPFHVKEELSTDLLSILKERMISLMRVESFPSWLHRDSDPLVFFPISFSVYSDLSLVTS